ncbi:MAG: YdbH domain-containing protein, partial [Alteripontixanthobacter sp.]
EDLGGGELSAVGQAANLAAAGQNARMASLTSDIAFRGGRLTADYDAQLRGVSAAGATLDMLTAKGVVRGSDGFDRLEMQARVEGSGLRGGNGLERALGEVASASEGTLAAPLIARLRSGLRRELRGGSFALDAVVRRTGSVISGVVPQARLRGATGATLLALSRVQFSTAGQGAPRFSANLATGGADLPRIAGRMEQRAGGAPVFRLQMAEYRARNAALAIPELAISQDAAGAYLFSGRITASGPLPGGFAQDLRVPIDGRWAGGDELVVWRGCTPVTFGRLQYADLALAGQSVTLCPPPGSAIVSRTGGALRIAAGLPSLDLSGRLGETPIVLRSGAVGFAYPGAVAVSQAEVMLGPADSAARFLIGDMTAEFGEDIAGTFDRADISIAAVPLDLRETRGNWRYADGRLTIADAAFTLTDREEIDRFEPLAGRGASLSLEDNMILAQAVLQSPASGRDIVAVDIRHDLSAGTGSADLDVAGITFDAALQPDDLSYLAKGVIANASGVVTGGGEVEWNAAGVTSRGAFSSDRLDFAAAFGPVSGASGTVEFTDLIGLTTAPGQRITVDSVNPGIVVGQGAIEFQLRNGELLDVEGGTLTFAGGDLIVRPLQMRIGRAEERRYLFEVRGLDASLFIERLELNNIAATGLFDGQLPLIFDAEGNGRIEEGLLVSRPPGGNISYVGELTYEDLGAMANFAFDALRSLDYGKMTVLMDGPLTGELVTRVEIDGVSQGEGAKRNIITRQLGKIPLQFRINIRASFSKLIGTFASMSDPALVPGLSDRLIRTEDGLRLRRSVLDEVLEEAGPSDENSGIILENIPSEEPVQGQESDQSP